MVLVATCVAALFIAPLLADPAWQWLSAPHDAKNKTGGTHCVDIGLTINFCF